MHQIIQNNNAQEFQDNFSKLKILSSLARPQLPNLFQIAINPRLHIDKHTILIYVIPYNICSDCV